MYHAILFVHSWLRWAVLAAALLVLLRAIRGARSKRSWQPGDERALFVLMRLVDVQFLLGLLLYLWLSPIVRSAFADMGAAMKSAPLRFFAIEHITSMVIAVGILHIGKARSRRADPVLRHAMSARWTTAFLFAVLIGIPWPALKHGRPLARVSLHAETKDPTVAPALYEKRCSVCHGAGGRGDGAAASAMQPAPRNFADVAWQSSVSDEQLRAVIRGGGTARNLSASMPAHPDLKGPQLDELVRYIRSLRVATP